MLIPSHLYVVKVVNEQIVNSDLIAFSFGGFQKYWKECLCLNSDIILIKTETGLFQLISDSVCVSSVEITARICKNRHRISSLIEKLRDHVKKVNGTTDLCQKQLNVIFINVTVMSPVHKTVYSQKTSRSSLVYKTYNKSPTMEPYDIPLETEFFKMNSTFTCCILSILKVRPDQF